MFRIWPTMALIPTRASQWEGFLEHVLYAAGTSEKLVWKE